VYEFVLAPATVGEVMLLVACVCSDVCNVITLFVTVVCLFTTLQENSYGSSQNLQNRWSMAVQSCH